MRLRWSSEPGDLRILDFDTESLAAGFADPEWVPQKLTCAAWSWVGEDRVHSVIGTYRSFFVPKVRAGILAPFIRALHEADVVTGHNIRRHDLPVINAECLRLGFGSLPPMRVQDTIRLPKTKGFKKGQDNLARLLRVVEEKQAMDWQAWEDAYAEPGWPQVRSRCVSDVEQHKAMRAGMLEAGWLRGITTWRP